MIDELLICEVREIRAAGDQAIDLELVTPKPELLPYVNAGATISATASGTQPANDFTFDGYVTVRVGL